MVDIHDIELTATDGRRLAATVFEPGDADPRASVLVAPATAVPRGYYRAYAAFLADAGLRALTLDYRGIGDSRPRRLRGVEATMSQWAERDAEAAIGWLREQGAGEPLLLVAHSFGGQGLGMMPSHRAFAAALFVTVQSGYWGHWPGKGKVGMWLLWHLLMPVATALWGYFPGRLLGLAGDLPAGVAQEWAGWGRDPDYLLRDADPARERGYASVHLPVLAYTFTDDGYGPLPAARAMLGCFPNATIEHRHVSPAEVGVDKIGHFGFFRERFRETLWRDGLQWLLERAEEARGRKVGRASPAATTG